MIEVPKHCRRLVKAYEAQGYTLVQSEHPRHLLRMEGQDESLVSTIYITMGKSPLSVMNRIAAAAYIHSTRKRIPYYSAAERKRAAALVFGTQKVGDST